MQPRARRDPVTPDTTPVENTPVTAAPDHAAVSPAGLAAVAAAPAPSLAGRFPKGINYNSPG